MGRDVVEGAIKPILMTQRCKLTHWKKQTQHNETKKKLVKYIVKHIGKGQQLETLSGKKYICSLGRPAEFYHWLAFSQSPRCLILISVLSLGHSPSCSALTAYPMRSIPVMPTVAEWKIWRTVSLLPVQGSTTSKSRDIDLLSTEGKYLLL